MVLVSKFRGLDLKAGLGGDFISNLDVMDGWVEE